MLKMMDIDSIRCLWADGKTQVEIAESLKIDRKTVHKYLVLDDFSDDVVSYIRSPLGSKLDKYKPEILELMKTNAESGVFHKQRWTATRMHQYLVEEKGYTELKDSYLLVQRYMRSVRNSFKRGYSDPGTLPLVWYPGEAQADFGEADFAVNGELKRLKYFVLSFPHSNRILCTVMPGENCECVCQALKDIFTFLGKVPKRIVFDNATGIGKRIQKTLMENEGFTRFRLHYQFTATYANPYSGHEKGSVENAVGTFRRNRFVPPMMITTDLESFNTSTMLPLSFAFRENEKHYEKGELIGELFKDDMNSMEAMNPHDFTVHRIDRRTLDKTGSFRTDEKHTYHIGPQKSGNVVIVEKTAWKVNVYDIGGHPIKSFDRVYDAENTDSYDMEALLSATVYKSRSWKNSIIRKKMEDGPLKDYLDSLKDDAELARGLYRLSSAADEFGFADACYAMNALLKNGKFPQAEDVSSYCRRLRTFAPDASDNPTGVNLSIYDGLLMQQGGEACHM